MTICSSSASSEGRGGPALAQPHCIMGILRRIDKEGARLSRIELRTCPGRPRRLLAQAREYEELVARGWAYGICVLSTATRCGASTACARNPSSCERGWRGRDARSSIRPLGLPGRARGLRRIGREGLGHPLETCFEDRVRGHRPPPWTSSTRRRRATTAESRAEAALGEAARNPGTRRETAVTRTSRARGRLACFQAQDPRDPAMAQLLAQCGDLPRAGAPCARRPAAWRARARSRGGSCPSSARANLLRGTDFGALLAELAEREPHRGARSLRARAGHRRDPAAPRRVAGTHLARSRARADLAGRLELARLSAR